LNLKTGLETWKEPHTHDSLRREAIRVGAHGSAPVEGASGYPNRTCNDDEYSVIVVIVEAIRAPRHVLDTNPGYRDVHREEIEILARATALSRRKQATTGKQASRTMRSGPPRDAKLFHLLVVRVAQIMRPSHWQSKSANITLTFLQDCKLAALILLLSLNLGLHVVWVKLIAFVAQRESDVYMPCTRYGRQYIRCCA